MKGHREYRWPWPGWYIVPDEDDGDPIVVIPISSKRVAIYDTEGAHREWVTDRQTGHRQLIIPPYASKHLVTIGSQDIEGNIRNLITKLSGMVTS